MPIRLFYKRLRNYGMPMAIESKLDCYALLELPSDVEDALTRAAFAAKVQEYGSEQFSGTPDEARQKLADLNAAYQILIDPVRRRRYDLHRRISAISAACAQTAPAETHAASRSARPAPGETPFSVTRRRHRAPLYALIAALVALTAFGTVRYSNRSPERPTASLPAPPAAVEEHLVVKVPLDGETMPLYPAAPADTSPSQDAKPSGSKVASANRRAGAAPVMTSFEACSDVVTVLGLCKP